MEKLHIVRAYRFELTRVQVNAVRMRVVSQLRNVAPELAEAVADGLGITELPEPLPKALKRSPKPEVTSSEALSLFARPGVEWVKTRRVAILVAPGTQGESATAAHEALIAEEAVPRWVGVKLGRIDTNGGKSLDVEVTMEAMPSALWDAVIVPGGDQAARTLLGSGHALEFLKDQYRHCKPILVIGAAAAVLEAAGIPTELPSGEVDTGLLIFGEGEEKAALTAFIAALSSHRHFNRESDPPRI